MSLVTLSGTISAADLNNNFRDKISALQSSLLDSGKVHQYDLDVLDLTSATAVGSRQLDFTPSHHMILRTMGLTVWNPDATSRTVTALLQAIDVNEEAVSKYLLDYTVQVPVTATSAAEYNATRYAAGSLYIPLYRGVTYRLSLANASATAVDRASAFVLARAFRRKK